MLVLREQNKPSWRKHIMSKVSLQYNKGQRSSRSPTIDLMIFY